MRLITTLYLSLTAAFCLGQVQTFYVKPIQTDAGYSASEDSCAISTNSSFQVNKLFLFMGGTGSSSSTDYNALRFHCADLGFDFINLSYPNDVAAASLANDSDSLAFNKYRQELCFGTPESAAVAVDTLNSIYTRTLKLLQYLDQTYPSDNWGQYLATPNSLEWSKIIVGGHSQGSGHAAYLAKQFDVDRVLMFSGPNDYSNTFSNSANWLRQAGSTSPNRHYSYLSLNDEVVPYSKQYVNTSGLDMLLNDDTTFVDNISSPYGNSKCLYTTQSPGIVLLNHNVPVKFGVINQNVWTYMLTSTITTGVETNTKVKDMKIYPNPTHDYIYLNSEASESEVKYSIYTLSGQLKKADVFFQKGGEQVIDISDFESGTYILNVNGFSQKVIKK